MVAGLLSSAPPRRAALDMVAWLRAQEDKDVLRFVAIGSVDDGKSTLIGRLLYDAHGLYVDQLEALARASERGSTRGLESTAELDLSLVTDGLEAEREQGITIDVAYRYFATHKRKFIIADTPGHEQYTRNMATGASTADVAVVLLDARAGVLPQTLRHMRIASLLGVRRVVVCVNKMDLVGFAEARFRALARAVEHVGRALGLATVDAIPVSALRGDNVVRQSPRTPWWTGPSLLGLLESVPVVDDRARGPLRIPVQIVLRPGLGYRGLAGQIRSGAVRRGDEITVMPSRRRVVVKGIAVGGVEVDEATAPMSVSIQLAEDIDVGRGDVLTGATDLPEVARWMEATLVWMHERPLDPSTTYLVKQGTRIARGRLTLLEGEGTLNAIVRVRLEAHEPLVVDSYSDCRGTGAFIVIDPDTKATVGAAMISRVLDEPARIGPSGRRGAVVRVAAPTMREGRAMARELARELEQEGLPAFVLPARYGRAARACARAGLTVVQPSSRGPLSVEIGAERIAASSAKELGARVVDALSPPSCVEVAIAARSRVR